MKPFITHDSTVPDLISQNYMFAQNDSVKPQARDSERRKPELEIEVKEHKLVERGAKLMQAIWGDQFRSDSLH